MFAVWENMCYASVTCGSLIDESAHDIYLSTHLQGGVLISQHDKYGSLRVPLYIPFFPYIALCFRLFLGSFPLNSSLWRCPRQFPLLSLSWCPRWTNWLLLKQPAPAQLKMCKGTFIIFSKGRIDDLHSVLCSFDQCKQNEDNYLKTCTQSGRWFSFSMFIIQLRANLLIISSFRCFSIVRLCMLMQGKEQGTFLFAFIHT